MYIFDEKMGRRKFLKTAGAGAAVVAGASLLPGCGSNGSGGESKWGREAGEWIPTCCNMCGGQCGILVHVVDGVVEKIEPNPWNPNNYSNISTDFFDGYTEEYGTKEGAAICAKGNAGLMSLYDPDRVKTPLKRTNPDRSEGADPGWKEISWEQAIKEIAAKMRELKDAGEAHKLLWMSEDHSFTHVQKDFCKLYGTPNYYMHSNLCDVSRKAAYNTTFGLGRPIGDFMHSKYVMLFGWNPTSALKWIYLGRIIPRGVENGAKLVVVDPYLSETAAKANEWISIRPSTDGALALAMGHVIIRENLQNKEFIESWSTGFDKYAAYVKDKTPKWAENITSVPAATIERLAKEFATTQPALADVWSGPGQHSNAVQGGRAVAVLNGLVGSFDAPGGMMKPDKKGNSHQHVNADKDARATLDKGFYDEHDKFPLSHKSGVYCQMFNNIAEDKGPYDAKMLMCVFQNPVMSVPGTETIKKAFSKLEMSVVIDTMMSETAMMADYVLPGTVYLERYDWNTHWVTWPVLGLRQPVVKPLFKQYAEYETVTMLGRELGIKDADGVDFFRTGVISGKPVEDPSRWYEEYLSKESSNGKPKLTLEEMKALPGAVWVSEKGTKYRKYASELSAEKLKGAWYDGPKDADGTAIYDKPKDKKGKRIGTVIGGKPVKGFGTKSGKMEFVSEWLAEKKDFSGNPIDPLPVYRPRDWQPSSEYPLYLINWKEANHCHTRTQNNAWLMELKPDNPLIVNPETAEKYGVSDGDEVLVESKYGKVRAKVKTSRRMHPDVVGLQHGFGHTALGRTARGKGVSDASLRLTKADPLSGQALHKENCVRISRA